MNEKEYIHLVKRLNDLEKHIVNLIHPIQEISEILKDKNSLNRLLSIVESPLKICDDNIRSIIGCFRTYMEYAKVNQETGLKTLSRQIEIMKKIITSFNFEDKKKEMIMKIFFNDDELIPLKKPEKMKKKMPRLRK